MCLGLKHCHDRKILHRDLKPENIFVTQQDIIKLGDFGVAKVLNTTLSKADTLVGTFAYLSPEVLTESPYDGKSDIWALGIVLYYMAALRLPFVSNDPGQMRNLII